MEVSINMEELKAQVTADLAQLHGPTFCFRRLSKLGFGCRRAKFVKLITDLGLLSSEFILSLPEARALAAKIKDLRQSGLVRHEIAAKLSITGEQVEQAFKLMPELRQAPKKIEKCLICGVDVQVNAGRLRRRTCQACRPRWAEYQRYRKRQARNLNIDVVCARPDCSTTFKAKGFKHKKKYCCSECKYVDLLRWNQRLAGESVYQRLAGLGSGCIACGERLAVQIHHTIFTKNKSDKNSPTVLLCPTHHVYVHHRLAKIENGKFVMLVDTDTLRLLKIKQPEHFTVDGLPVSSKSLPMRRKQAQISDPSQPNQSQF